MNKVFCTNCGARYEYNLSPPKFCSSCGQNLSEFSVGSVQKPRQKTKAEVVTVYDDDDDEDSEDAFTTADRVPEITKLDVEVEYRKPQGEFVLGSKDGKLVFEDGQTIPLKTEELDARRK